jgi:hypothetical protein
MIGLLVLTGAVFIAVRLIGPVLRVVIGLLARLLGATLVIALAILVLVGLLTHGMLI